MSFYDHRAYLPSAVCVVEACLFAPRRAEKRVAFRYLVFGFVTVALPFSVFTIIRIQDYASPLSIAKRYDPVPTH